MRRQLLATLAGLSILAGCGTAMPAGRVGSMPARPADTLTVQHGGMMRMVAELGLTAAQKAKIKDIIRNHVCDPESKSAAADALKAVVLSATIDRAQLAAAIEAHMGDREAKIDRKIAMLTAIRDVLTPEQQQMIAERKRAESTAPRRMGGKKHRFMERIAKQLAMNSEQRQAFMAVHAAFRANMKAKRTARREAMANFFATGDAAALKTALLAIQTKPPIDAMVNAVSALTLEQRRQLVDIMESHRTKMCERLSRTEAMGCPTLSMAEEKKEAPKVEEGINKGETTKETEEETEDIPAQPEPKTGSSDETKTETED